MDSRRVPDFSKYSDDELIASIDRIDKFRNPESYESAMKEFEARKEKNPDLALNVPWWTFSWVRFSMISFSLAFITSLIWGEKIREYFGWEVQCKKYCPDFFVLCIAALIVNAAYYKTKFRK